jgi:hypothetical protein
VRILRIAGMVALTAAVLATAAGARIEHYFVNVTVNGPGHVTGSGSPSDINPPRSTAQRNAARPS